MIKCFGRIGSTVRLLVVFWLVFLTPQSREVTVLLDWHLACSALFWQLDELGVFLLLCKITTLYKMDGKGFAISCIRKTL